MVLALVNMLESHYLHPNPLIRDAAITVTTRLIVTNPNEFVGNDNLNAV